MCEGGEGKGEREGERDEERERELMCSSFFQS